MKLHLILSHRIILYLILSPITSHLSPLLFHRATQRHPVILSPITSFPSPLLFHRVTQRHPVILSPITSHLSPLLFHRVTQRHPVILDFAAGTESNIQTGHQILETQRTHVRTVLHCSVMHFIALHCILVHCIEVHFGALRCTVLCSRA